MADLKHPPAGTTGASLHRSRLGVAGVVFFVVAAAAPLVGMTGGVPLAIVLGNGAAVPGTYVAVGVTLLLFSVGYAAMSHRVTNSGAFFAYVGRGLGIGPGVGSAFASLVAYLAVQLALFGFFGAASSARVAQTLDVSWPWWVWSLIAWAAVLALSLTSVDVGAKILGPLMILEIGSLLLMSLGVLFDSEGRDGLDLEASFAPSNVLIGGLGGSAGIALVAAFASYIGFEATAAYAEESKEPKKTVPRATYAAVLIITALFSVAALAVVAGLGSARVVERAATITSVEGVPLADPAQLVYSVADTYIGSWLGTLMSWVLLSSLFAGLLAFQNSAARYFYALGRGRVLPGALDRVNRFGAPWAASSMTAAISGIVIVWFAVRDLDPVLNLFFWLGGLAVVAIVLVEALVCIAVIVCFRREGEDHRKFHTMIAPALAFAGLVIGEYLLMSRFGLLTGAVQQDVDPTTQSWGLNSTGWILVLTPFMVLGIGWAIGLARRGQENEDSVRDLVS